MDSQPLESLDSMEELFLQHAIDYALGKGWDVDVISGVLQIASDDHGCFLEIAGGGTPMLHLTRDDGADVREPLGTDLKSAAPMIEATLDEAMAPDEPAAIEEASPAKQGDPREWGLNVEKDYSNQVAHVLNIAAD